MPTQNRRVATYLPKEIDDRFQEFKIERNLSSDSQALIVVLSEFLGVNQKVAHEVDCSLFVTQKQFNELAEKVENIQIEADGSELFHNSLSELFSKFQQLDERIKALDSTQSYQSALSTGELAKRLGIDGSTLSHWKSTGKKGKSPDELLKATREKDPDGIGWSVVPETGKFRPERELPSGSLDVLQGDLLSNPTSELSSSS
jgi:DNA-binding transcriptional regulator YiaG